jgi:cyclic pyranopterin phosphate synthase
MLQLPIVTSMPKSMRVRQMQGSTTAEKLIDNFGRHVNYVRISVTDRCDFRCVYCMSEDMTFVPRAKILSLEELAQISRAFVELGVKKIRITGGEPLVRRNVVKLLSDIAALDGLEELTITTNGSQLPRLANKIRAAGVRRLNISLDSLDPDLFRRLTRTGELDNVLEGIEAARKAGFEKIKINSVILKNRNHHEVVPLVDFASSRGMDISFIEEMPLGAIEDHDRAEAYYSSDQIRRDIEAHYTVVPSSETTGGPSRYFKISEAGTKIGFISPHSHNFCDSCNRVRLTAEGRLLLCLGQEHSIDLRHVVRSFPGDREMLKDAIRQSMSIKPQGHDFNLEEKPIIFRHMSATGG